MIVKLTTAAKNEVIYVNFDYVRIMRSVDTFTELTLSDDRYHKIAVVEKPTEIYEMLYPSKDAAIKCCCHSAENDYKVENEVIQQEATVVAAEVKKPTAKKTTAKTQEAN